MIFILTILVFLHFSNTTEGNILQQKTDFQAARTLQFLGHTNGTHNSIKDSVVCRF